MLGERRCPRRGDVITDLQEHGRVEPSHGQWRKHCPYKYPPPCPGMPPTAPPLPRQYARGRHHVHLPALMRWSRIDCCAITVVCWRESWKPQKSPAAIPRLCVDKEEMLTYPIYNMCLYTVAVVHYGLNKITPYHYGMHQRGAMTGGPAGSVSITSAIKLLDRNKYLSWKNKVQKWEGLPSVL